MQENIITAGKQDDIIKDQPDVVWGDLDWTGWEDHSLVTQGYQFIKSKLDPTYDVPGSIQDLESRNKSNQRRIDMLAKVPESPESSRLKERAFKRMEEDSAKLQLLQAEQEMGLPGLEEVWDAISEDRERFAFNMVQETINKPELLVAGVLGGWGFGILGAKTLTAMNVAGKAATSAKVVGSMSGAYTGGVATGTVDRAIESANKTGRFQLGKSYEQSQMDGVIAASMWGLGSAVASGARAIRGTKRSMNFKKHIKDTDTDFNTAKDSFDKANPISEQDLMDTTLHPTDVQPYKDSQGVIHIIETAGIYEPKGQKATMDLVQAAEFKISKQELTKVNKLLNENLDKRADVDQRKWELKDLESEGDIELIDQIAKLEEESIMLSKDIAKGQTTLGKHSVAVRAQEELYGYTQPVNLEPPTHLEIEGPDGLPMTLKRIDNTKSINDNGIMIDGYRPTDMSMVAQNNGYQNPWTALVTNMYRGATAPLTKLGKASPTANLLIKKLNPDSSDPKSPMWSLQEDIIFNQGTYNNRMAGVIRNLKEHSANPRFEAEVRENMRGSIISEDPQVLKASQSIRALLDDHLKYLQDAGVKVTSVDKDYLPRKFNHEVLKTDQGKAEFIQRTMVDQGLTRSAAEKSLRNILENRTEVNDVLTANGSGSNKVPYGTRSLDRVKDMDISNLLSDNFFEDITKHLMSGVRRAEMSKVFGDGGSKLKDMVKEISKESEDIGRTLKGDEQQRIYDIYNAMQGSYKPIDSEALTLVNNGLTTLTNLSKLGLATVTSLTEPLVTLARLNESTGVSGALNTYVQAGKSGFRKVFKGLKEHESIAEAREIGLITDQAIAEALDNMQGVGMQGKLSTLNHKFFKATMLHQWTEISRGMAYGAAKKDLQKTIAGLAKSTMDSKSTDRKRWLSQAGIKESEAIAWINGGGDMKAPFATQLKRASMRMANEIIANPTPINKPLWMSSPKMRLVSQLKTYPIVFGNTIIKKQWDEFKASNRKGRKAANIAITAATLTTGQLLVGMLKDKMKGQEIERDRDKQKRDVMRAAISQLGPVGVVAPAIESLGERYVASQAISSISPTAGSFIKVFEDPKRGFLDLAPGSSVIPSDVKDKIVK